MTMPGIVGEYDISHNFTIIDGRDPSLRSIKDPQELILLSRAPFLFITAFLIFHVSLMLPLASESSVE